jgi:hypothetical protein
MLLVLIGATSALANSHDLDFLNALRSGRLYRLAEIHAARLQSRDDLTARGRVELAIALAETHAQQALDLPAAERDAAWAKADETLDTFLTAERDNPRRLLVEIEQALLLVARSDLLRIEAEGTRHEQQGLETAREHLRQALRVLDDATQTVERQLAERSRSPASISNDEQFSPRELDAIDRNLDFQLGRGYRIQALCYPARSADRDNAFLLAVEHLQRPVHGPVDESTTWVARLECLRAYRELGKLDEVERRHAEWTADPPPESFAAALTAESARLRLASGEIAAAVDISAAGANRSDSTLALAHLEALIAAWRGADGDGANVWSEHATRQLNHIRQIDDPLAARQAEVLVGRAFAESPSGQNDDALVLAAENLYHAGRIDEALAAYDRAANQARENGKPNKAFDLAFTAAAVARQSRDWAGASSRYRQAAVAMPANPQAAAAHRLAIVTHAEAIRDQPLEATPESLAAYQRLLDEHLATWPDSETADDVRWWSVRLAMSDRRWAEALDQLETISPEGENFDSALVAAVECFKRLLPDALSRKRQELVARGRRFLQPAITGDDNRWPAEWTDLQLDIAVALAELHLMPDVEDTDYAERLLRAAWADVAAKTDEPLRRGTIRSALLHTLVEREDYQAAAELLRHDSPGESLAIIKRLAAASPEDGDLQETYAALLSDAETTARLGEALQRWTAVERRSRRGGSRWSRARRARGNVLRRLGRDDEADKLERLTELLDRDEVISEE